MFERIVEIITFVLSELQQNKRIADIDIDVLVEKGYTDSEISTAFSWLVDRLEFEDNLLNIEGFTGSDSFRILHSAERDLFTEKAWGELIQYHSLGILNNEAIETIIEKSLMTGIYKIDEDFLKQMVASLIFNAGNTNMPGNRVMLNGNDTIN